MCYITYRTKERKLNYLPDIHKSTLRISPMVQTLVYVMKGDMTYVNA